MVHVQLSISLLSSLSLSFSPVLPRAREGGRPRCLRCSCWRPCCGGANWRSCATGWGGAASVTTRGAPYRWCSRRTRRRRRRGRSSVVLSSSLLFVARRRLRVHVGPPPRRTLRRAPASAPVTPDGRCRDARGQGLCCVSRSRTTARGGRQGRSRGALPHSAPRESRRLHHRRRRPPATPAMVVVLARG